MLLQPPLPKACLNVKATLLTPEGLRIPLKCVVVFK